MSCPIRIGEAGRAALAALAARPATVFASFGRSAYVETAAGIACLGVPALGRGPLNALVEGFSGIEVGAELQLDLESVSIWTAPRSGEIPEPGKVEPFPFLAPWRTHPQAQAFLGWIAAGARSSAPPEAEALIGLGPGLTPAGDDFIGGAMIALQSQGQTAISRRIGAWVLPLAGSRTGRISRAHLACAAAGEGHEALHALLAGLARHDAGGIAAAVSRLERIGHSSGLDAAAGALLAPGAAARFDATGGGDR